MAKLYNMRQCGLRRENAADRAWIPEKFAQAGRILQLKDHDTGEWEGGWCVTSVGDGVLTSDIVTERSQDHKRTREASDI